jgi:hypothetical protein
MSDQPEHFSDPGYLASFSEPEPNNVVNFPVPAIHRPSSFQTLAGFMADYVHAIW